MVLANSEGKPTRKIRKGNNKYKKLKSQYMKKASGSLSFPGHIKSRFTQPTGITHVIPRGAFC